MPLTRRRPLVWAALLTMLGGVLLAAAPTAGQASTRPVVFAASEGDGGTHDIWRVGSDGSGLTQLTTDGDFNRDPVLSPDGNRIAFRSGRDDRWGLFVMDADGSDRQRLTTDRDTGPTWHPDGDRVVFSRITNEGVVLMQVPAAGGDATPFRETAGVDEEGADLIGTGEELGHLVNEGENTRIRIIDDSGGERFVDPSGPISEYVPLDFAGAGDRTAVTILSGCVSFNACVYEPRILELSSGNTFDAGFPEMASVEPDSAISVDGTELVSWTFDDGAGRFALARGGIGDSGVTPLTDPQFRQIGEVDWGTFGDGTGSSGGPGGGGGGGGDGGDSTDRLAGDSRFATAAAIAMEAFPDGAAVVHLARADVVVDAVAGGSLTEGPILLVPSCGPVPEATASAIAAMGPRTVLALGGTAAVCDATLAEAAAIVGASTDRLAGDSRYGTAAAIARHAFPDGSSVVVLARADLVVDAVAGGVLTKGPTLLVPACGALPAVVRDTITTLGPGQVVALGGPNAVCDAVIDEAAAVANTSNKIRLAGSSRYGTSVAIARAEFPGTVGRVYLARADVFVDAVAGGVLTDGPILLVPSCDAVHPDVAEALRDFRPDRVTALGGPAAVCDDVLGEAALHAGT